MAFQVGIALQNLKMPLHEACRKAAEIGFDSVQLHFRHGEIDFLKMSGERRKEEARRIRDLGLEISGICILPGETDYSGNDNMRRALEKWLEAACDLAAPVIPTRFIGVFQGIGQTPFGPMHPPPFDVREAIDPVVRAAEAAGVAFAHETGLEPPEDVARFIASFSSKGIGVNYDPANLCAFGFDWIGGVEILARHIVHVHAKDAIRTPEGGFREMPLGAGQVGFDNFLRALVRTGYDGCIALERESPADIIAETIEAIKFLRGGIAALDKKGEPGNE